MIEGDGLEYEILVASAKHVSSNNISGLTCEIGVRRGLGSCLIMQEVQTNDEKRFLNQHVAIDPYGSIPYFDDVLGDHDGGYSNSMRRETASSLFQLANQNNWNLTFMFIESSEYFVRYADGVPVYDDRSGKKSILDKYSLVHFDGQHTRQDVIDEFAFFENKMCKGGIMVFDDIETYDHSEIERDFILKNTSYKLFAKGKRKAAYIFEPETLRGVQ